MKLYVGHDVKSDLWSPPITMETDEVLQQYLDVLVNTHGNGHYHLYPEDFIFYSIGEYDEETGSVALYPEKEFAVNLAGLKKPCKYCNAPEEIANESVKVQ